MHYDIINLVMMMKMSAVSIGRKLLADWFFLVAFSMVHGLRFFFFFFSHTLRSSSVVRMLVVQRLSASDEALLSFYYYVGSLASMCWTKALKGGRKAPRPSNTGPSSSTIAIWPRLYHRREYPPRMYGVWRPAKLPKTTTQRLACFCFPLKSQRNMTWW